MRTDAHAFIGGVPYRDVPHPEPQILARVLAREGVDAAWVADLPSAFGDAHARNDALLDGLAPHAAVLRAVITVDPAREDWEEALARGAGRGAVAVRTYAGSAALEAVAARCAARGLPLVLAAHLEPAAAALVRSADAADVAAAARAGARVVVTGGDRAFVERALAALDALAVREARDGAARERVWFDIARIAGPSADDLAALLRAAGPARFVYGSGWPLRLTQVPKANLELLPAELAGARLADVSEIVAR